MRHPPTDVRSENRRLTRWPSGTVVPPRNHAGLPLHRRGAEDVRRTLGDLRRRAGRGGLVEHDLGERAAAVRLPVPLQLHAKQRGDLRRIRIEREHPSPARSERRQRRQLRILRHHEKRQTLPLQTGGDRLLINQIGGDVILPQPPDEMLPQILSEPGTRRHHGDFRRLQGKEGKDRKCGDEPPLQGKTAPPFRQQACVRHPFPYRAG